MDMLQVIIISSHKVIPNNNNNNNNNNLHPNTYIQLQKSVIPGTCSIVRDFLNYK